MSIHFVMAARRILRLGVSRSWSVMHVSHRAAAVPPTKSVSMAIAPATPTLIVALASCAQTTIALRARMTASARVVSIAPSANVCLDVSPTSNVAMALCAPKAVVPGAEVTPTVRAMRVATKMAV